MSASKTLVLYDGSCVLCCASVRWIRCLDWRNRIEYLDIQDWDRVQARFPTIDRDEASGEIHVVTPDGAIFKGYFGVRAIAARLPLTVGIVPLLYLPGFTWLGPRLYRFIARRRYQWFGRTACTDSTCKIPG